MKILIGDRWNVDFDKAIKMTEEQKNEFVNFLKSIFEVVQEKHVDYFRQDRLGDKLFNKEWEPEELKILLDIEIDNYRVSEMLGRSWLSVDIKRGPLVSELLSWVAKMGKDFFKEDKKKMVEEFIKYKLDRKNKIKSLKEEAKKIRQELSSREGGLNDVDLGLDDIEYWKKKQQRLKEIENELNELDKD